jgi:hypothetical protein
MPGDPIWIREGVLVAKEIPSIGISVGTILNKPRRAILLDRKTINDKKYIQAYIDDMGERFIEEDEVLELNSNGDKNVSQIERSSKN